MKHAKPRLDTVLLSSFRSTNPVPPEPVLSAWQAQYRWTFTEATIAFDSLVCQGLVTSFRGGYVLSADGRARLGAI